MKKQLLVSVDRGETRVALLEATGSPGAAKKAPAPSSRAKKDPAAGYRVAELYFERRGARSIVGNIYKGKVDNVLAGLEAAFVDIGLDKNGFLHVDEIVVPGVDVGRRGRGGKEGGSKITELIKPGQEIVVQVVKDPLKSKGARLSMELTIAGRYMVYAPTGEGVGVSRRLDDKERERLRREAKGLDLRGGGAIIRTAAHGATREDFERELQYLFKLREVLDKRVAETAAPGLVFQEADLSVRVVRDIFSEHFERAIVDDPKQHQRLVSFFTRTAPELVDRVELYEEKAALFAHYGVEKVIDGLMTRRVDLPSGGYLIIDYAEALTVIDVNSGSFIGRGKGARLEDTITTTNLEAAEEVVNQLRLRDIGGIIVIDFIDMARARNRDAVLKTLRKTLDEDRTKTFTAEISKLGLVEMTRQNVTEGVREIISRPCPTCDGDGVIKSEETIAIEFERRLRTITKKAPKKHEAFLVQMNPRVSAMFTGQGKRVLHALEEETGRRFHFTGHRGPAARPLRHPHGGLARGGHGARGAVPRGRRGARAHRRAAHVRRRRRRRQDRRLHHLRQRRRAVRRHEEARARRARGPHVGDGDPHRRGRASPSRRSRAGRARRASRDRCRAREGRRGAPSPRRGECRTGGRVDRARGRSRRRTPRAMT